MSDLSLFEDTLIAIRIREIDESVYNAVGYVRSWLIQDRMKINTDKFDKLDTFYHIIRHFEKKDCTDHDLFKYKISTFIEYCKRLGYDFIVTISKDESKNGVLNSSFIDLVDNKILDCSLFSFLKLFKVQEFSIKIEINPVKYAYSI